MGIQVRHDRERGCGWRKPRGLYLVSGGLAAPCGALPVPLCRCPVCGNGIKPTRGWTWVDAGALLAPAVALCGGPSASNPSRGGDAPSCGRCPLARLTGRHGLLWIGGQYYANVDDFKAEVLTQGVSRRIVAVPKDFRLGETWVLLAHREAMAGADGKMQPAIFQAFKPIAIEYVVKGDETAEEIEQLEKRGLTPVTIERDTRGPLFQDPKPAPPAGPTFDYGGKPVPIRTDRPPATDARD